MATTTPRYTMPASVNALAWALAMEASILQAARDRGEI